jgi:hypothetical protein
MQKLILLILKYEMKQLLNLEYLLEILEKLQKLMIKNEWLK